MACGKGNANQPIEDFITHSPAPVDMAAKMSAIYTELSFKVEQAWSKLLFFCQRQKDLLSHLFIGKIFLFVYLWGQLLVIKTFICST